LREGSGSRSNPLAHVRKKNNVKAQLVPVILQSKLATDAVLVMAEYIARDDPEPERKMELIVISVERLSTRPARGRSVGFPAPANWSPIGQLALRPAQQALKLAVVVLQFQPAV
jgi:hypothetical protein